MTWVTGMLRLVRRRSLLEGLSLVLLWHGPVGAEVVDQSVSVLADAQLTQLAETATLLPLENRNAVAGGTADLDGDGDLDILIWHRLPDEPPFSLINDGHGHMSDESITRLPTLKSGETLTAVLVDLNGDGSMDAYVGRSPNDHVWLNNGQGVFTDVSAAWLPEGWGGTISVAVGDITGDQRPDLVVVQAGQGHVLENMSGHALREIGDGVFPQGAPDGVSHVGLFDLDGDGAPDLVAAGINKVRVFHNDHSLFRLYATRLNPHRYPITGIAAGDLDGDGDLDFVLSRQGPPLLWQDGRLDAKRKGDTQRLLSINAPPSFANGVTLNDLDRDGRPDVVLPITGPNILVLSPGTRRFWRTPPNWLVPDNEASRYAFVGDFNGDCLMDLYVANDSKTVSTSSSAPPLLSRTSRASHPCRITCPSIP